MTFHLEATIMRTQSDYMLDIHIHINQHHNNEGRQTVFNEVTGYRSGSCPVLTDDQSPINHSHVIKTIQSHLVDHVEGAFKDCIKDLGDLTGDVSP